jgi:DMSO/TMAO reductase YedYZ molybdopterin-dependent catalytic subunit
MDEKKFVSRGFVGKRRDAEAEAEHRIPPGQYVVQDFPVLSAGPTPHTPLDQWTFSIEGLVREPASWRWEEFLALPAREWVADIHCVTKWSKLGTKWKGVSIDTLLEHADLQPSAAFVTAFSDGGYTTNIPLPELLNGQAFVAYEYEDAPLEPVHGEPARLLVPHLYFWKSAKWVRGLRLTDEDVSGFWETLGYNDHGDPWKEERYQGD